MLFTALLTGVGMLGGIELRERPERPLQTVELRFGTETSTDAVGALLASIAGLPSNAVVALDVLADAHGIRHRLVAAQQTIDTLRSQWRLLPTLRFEEPQDTSQVDWSGGVVLRLAGRYPVLRSDASVESVASLLGALQPLSGSERLLVRWVLAPGRRPSLPQPAGRNARRAESALAHVLHDEGPRADHLRVLRAKYAGPVLAGVGVVAVEAAHPKRAAHLVSRVVSVMRSRGGAYGHITTRKRGGRQIARLLERRSFRGGDLYTPGELVGVVGMPCGALQIPGLVLGSAPVLMPSPGIPSTGRVLAASTWPGVNRILAQPLAGALSHCLVCGPTGVGKSSLICSLAEQDLKAKRGFLLLDGKGDLAQDVLARAGGRDDVIVLDPGRGGPLPGLRVFGSGEAESAELTADLVLGIFADLFRDSWGPLSSRWLRAALVLLGHDREASLADLPFVFSDDAFRRRLVARVSDPIQKGIWSAFSSMGAAERAHQLAAPLNKIEEVIGRRVVRGVLGPKPTLDMHEVLRSGKVVVVSLSPGKIGTPAARLIGALVIHQMFLAVQARAAIAPHARRPYFLYVDEPKVLGDIPVPLDSLYELARGLGVGVLLSAQSLTQLPADLRSAAATNSSTVVAFRQAADDSRLLSRELPGVASEALQHLGKYEVLMRIGLGPGEVSAPVSGRTLPPSVADSDPETVRRASAARYGTDPAEVDAALAKRHQTAGLDDAPVGLTRRES